MSDLLAPLDLEAIASASRHCFLHEEAPDYLVILEQGISQLGNPQAVVNLDEEYQKLIRAAHSLKGGAGLAAMPVLSQLSHKVEDLLIAIQEKRVSLHEKVSSDRILHQAGKSLAQPTSAYQLLLMSLDRISALLFAALNQPELAAETIPEMTDPVCEEIDQFLAGQGGADSKKLADLPVTDQSINNFIRTSLEVDLEECLQRIESSLRENSANGSISKVTARENIQEAIGTFAAECTLLGDALGVTWLSQIGSQLEQWSQEKDISLQKVTEAIGQIRQQRNQTLNANYATETASLPSKNESPPPEEFADLDLPELPPLSSPVPQRFLKYLIRQPETARSPENISLRISLSRIDRMTDTVGKLLINYEQLEQCEQQLKDAILGQKLLPNSAPKSLNGTAANNLQLAQSIPEAPTNQQLDQNRIDIILGTRNLRLTLADMRASLERLYQDLTAARMVPFRDMTERFFVLIDNLNHQYKKAVKLVVSGQDVLLDRWIVEQLQTPLTHLVRNAFDHGIELPKERILQGKHNQATIHLSAVAHGTYIVISIADDGRGINPEKIYQKALEKGLISAQEKTWSENELLQFLFIPGFSTAERVTDISGRGVGLDIVVQEVGKLGGSVAVKSRLGMGTQFTVTIPLTLNILPLHIFRCQEQILAIPTANVLETIRLSDFPENQGMFQWQNQLIPKFYLNQLLPLRSIGGTNSQTNSLAASNFALVVKVKENPIILVVDALLGERRLVLKPLDYRVPIPPYIAGCTVLGNRQIVPVLSPDHLASLIKKATANQSPKVNSEQLNQEQLKNGGIKPSKLGRILIIDDSRTVRRSLQQLLSQAGFLVVEASDGAVGLATVEQAQGQFDLVISDVEMPHLDGFGFLQKLRASQWSALPVGMLTSQANETYVKKAKELGAKFYLLKPFKPVELLNLIGKTIANNCG